MFRSQTMVKKLLFLALLLILVPVTWASVQLADIGPKVTRMSVRWICPCVFMEGRDVEYCVSTVPSGGVDLSPWLSVQQHSEQQRVSVRALGLFPSTAQYEPGFSCTLGR